MGFLRKLIKNVMPYYFVKKYQNINNIKVIDNRLELEQMIQVGISNQYKIMTSLSNKLNNFFPKFIDTGFKVYSQFDEDGILLYIFSLIGFTNRKIIEICCGHGKECNTANLIINHACNGLLFDGDEKNIEMEKISLKQISQHG